MPKAELQPPQSLDAEQAVLGAILKDCEAVTMALAAMKENDFYSPRHRRLFSAAQSLSAKGEPVDVTTVANELGNDGLIMVGGRVYLVELCEGVASTANVEHHIGIVVEKSMARQVIATANETIRSAYAQEMPIVELIGDAEESMAAINNRSNLGEGVRLSSVLPDAMATLEEWQSGEYVKKLVRTGLINFDHLILGVERKDLVIVAGRPSMGKTELLMETVKNISHQQKIACQVFSLEMTVKALAIRQLTSEANVSFDTFKRKRATESDWKKLTAANARLYHAPIFINDVSGLTPAELRVIARRMKAKHNIGVIGVDYIQLMSGGGKHDNRQIEVAYISRELKKLAKELDVVVFAVSQLNRQPEYGTAVRKPRLSDLRESGAIEQDADSVWFVHKPDPDDPKALIIAAKVRNGVCGEAPMLFIDGHWKSEELNHIGPHGQKG